jgi:ribosomal protein S18 acetylase RimI-like enzyme
MKISKEEYLKNPCGLLSIPYWKEQIINLPDNMKIVNDMEYKDSYKEEYTDKLFFRLIHRLYPINPINLSTNYSIETINIDIQLEDVVEIINKCYANISVKLSEIKEWTKREVFDNSLWIYIKDNQSNKIVALGIAEIDKDIKEGVLEWIQVLPNYQGKGLGQSIVNEILKRMIGKVDFVTVSGEVDNQTNPELLYRKCGFTGNDVWHIMTKR